MTYADILRPAVRRYATLYDAMCIVGGSALVALSAHIAVRLSFTPVPVTGQTLAVLLLGATLGSRRGAFALLLYLAEGLVGLPVFSGGGVGLARLAGPTGGYLVGMAAAAWVVGLLAERGWDRRVGATILAMLIGNGVIYAFGVSWLARFVGVGQALPLGLFPFIVGDLLKLALAVALLPAGWQVVRGRRGDTSKPPAGFKPAGGSIR